MVLNAMSAVLDLAEHEINLFNNSQDDDWDNQRDTPNDGYGFGFTEYQKPSRKGNSRQQHKKDRRSKWDD